MSLYRYSVGVLLAGALALVFSACVEVGGIEVGSASQAMSPGKVLICHIPPGNPANAHTIDVSVRAQPAHLAHGDLVGSCEDYCRDDGGVPQECQEDCSNGVDDDGDEYADCWDDDCAEDPACQTESDCDDESDNDADGYTDCDDSDCAEDPACASQCPNTMNPYDEGWVGSGEECLEPFLGGCLDDFQPGCCEQCEECVLYGDGESCDNCYYWLDLCRNEQGEYYCNDGIDNDADGATDCDDSGCEEDPSCGAECAGEWEYCEQASDCCDYPNVNCGDGGCDNTCAGLGETCYYPFQCCGYDDSINPRTCSSGGGGAGVCIEDEPS